MIDEKEMLTTLDAAGAPVTAEMLDRVLCGIKYKVGRPLHESARYVSHPIQTVMYERAGFALSEVGDKRVAANGVEWRVDGALPLDCILVETEAGAGLLKNLYPVCYACRERRP